MNLKAVMTLTAYPERNGYTAIILAVTHKKFSEINLQEHKLKGTIIYDVKGILNKAMIDGRL